MSSDPCNINYSCNEPDKSITIYSDSGGFTHNINTSIAGFLTTSRTFTVRYGWQNSRTISKFYHDPGSLEYGVCGTDGNIPSSHVSENCTITKVVPYYFDLQNGIKVFRKNVETLSFDISSTKVAPFKQKFGTMYFHKLLIPDSVKVQGTESFILQQGTTETTLDSVTYEFNPFPMTDAQGTQGLGGSVIQNQFGTPESNIACILLFPMPPAQGIPQDADVAAYGFYDYTEDPFGTGAGNLLGQADGGKDMYYPYWCRQMASDPVWADAANRRWAIRWDHVEPRQNQDWIPTLPDTYNLPFGSFVINSDGVFIYSCLLEYSQRAGGSVKIKNYMSIGNTVITLSDLPSQTNAVLYPIVPL